MKPKAKVAVKSKEKDLQKNMAILKNMDVLVGVPEGSDIEDEGDDASITNAQLAFIQSNGARSKAMKTEMDMSGKSYGKAMSAFIKSHGSPIWHIPPRPFLQPAIDEKKKQISDLIGRGIKSALNGEISKAKRCFGDAGMVAENAAKDYINDGDNLLPNAPSTIKAKSKGIDGGAPPPLVNDGDLRNSITHVIRTGGK